MPETPSLAVLAEEVISIVLSHVGIKDPHATIEAVLANAGLASAQSGGQPDNPPDNPATDLYAEDMEALADAIYAGGDEAEWLTTADGSANAASWEYAHRVRPVVEALAARDSEAKIAELTATIDTLISAFRDTFQPDFNGVDWRDDAAIQSFAARFIRALLPYGMGNPR